MSNIIDTRRKTGVTLVEMMVAGALLSVVVAYLMGTFSANQKSYVVVDQVTEAQQNMRAIAGFIERDARHSGFMVPLGGALCGVDNTATSDWLYLSDWAAIDPGDRIIPDLGASFAGVNVVAGAQALTLDDLVIDGTASYDTDANGAMDSDFQVGGGVIVADRSDPSRGSACGTVTAVSIPNDRIDVFIRSGPLAGAATGDLIAVPANEYQVDANLQLLRNGAAFAQGVEDLQFALFVDANDDNLIDPNEYRGDGVGANYTASAVDNADANEIRVNLVMRTRTPEADRTLGQFQATENRVAVVGNDGFRRRVNTSTVLLRNVITRR